jgi:hypothetical protein
MRTVVPFTRKRRRRLPRGDTTTLGGTLVELPLRQQLRETSAALDPLRVENAQMSAGRAAVGSNSQQPFF